MSIPARAWAVRGLLGVVAALVVACGGGAPRAATHASIAEGRRLFASERCGACHALAAARAHGRDGPDLDTSERLGRAQLRTALAEGANGMPSYAGRLTPGQLDAVAAFLLDATHR